MNYRTPAYTPYSGPARPTTGFDFGSGATVSMDWDAYEREKQARLEAARAIERQNRTRKILMAAVPAAIVGGAALAPVLGGGASAAGGVTSGTLGGGTGIIGAGVGGAPIVTGAAGLGGGVTAGGGGMGWLSTIGTEAAKGLFGVVTNRQTTKAQSNATTEAARLQQLGIDSQDRNAAALLAYQKARDEEAKAERDRAYTEEKARYEAEQAQVKAAWDAEQARLAPRREAADQMRQKLAAKYGLTVAPYQAPVYPGAAAAAAELARGSQASAPTAPLASLAAPQAATTGGPIAPLTALPAWGDAPAAPEAATNPMMSELLRKRTQGGSSANLSQLLNRGYANA